MLEAYCHLMELSSTVVVITVEFQRQVRKNKYPCAVLFM